MPTVVQQVGQAAVRLAVQYLLAQVKPRLITSAVVIVVKVQAIARQ